MELLAFGFVWITSVAAAIAVGSHLRWWLIWRLLVFVPLFGEITLFGCFGNAGGPISPHLLTDPYNWGWLGIFFAYGVILYGPIAIVLGGLGWFAVRAKALPLRVSKASIILLGTLAGAVAGGCFEIAYRIAADLGLRNFGAVWTWGLAWVAGGAAGGFIVAYYATKGPLRGGNYVERRNTPVPGSSN